MPEIFNINHETGDLSQYNSTVTDSGDLSVTEAAALAGTYGMQVQINDIGGIYGHKDFAQLTSAVYRYRIYIDPNDLEIASGDSFRVAIVYDGGADRSQITLKHDGSNYQVRANVIDDSSNWNNTSYYDITNEAHYIEVLVEYASGAGENDGRLTLWIDGAQQEQKGNLDVYSVTKPQDARLGAVAGLDASTSGTLYLDEFVLRDDDTEIGPEGPSAYEGSVGQCVGAGYVRFSDRGGHRCVQHTG